MHICCDHVAIARCGEHLFSDQQGQQSQGTASIFSAINKAAWQRHTIGRSALTLSWAPLKSSVERDNSSKLTFCERGRRLLAVNKPKIAEAVIYQKTHR